MSSGRQLALAKVFALLRLGFHYVLKYYILEGCCWQSGVFEGGGGWGRLLGWIGSSNCETKMRLKLRRSIVEFVGAVEWCMCLSLNKLIIPYTYGFASAK